MEDRMAGKKRERDHRFFPKIRDRFGYGKWDKVKEKMRRQLQQQQQHQQRQQQQQQQQHSTTLLGVLPRGRNERCTERRPSDRSVRRSTHNSEVVDINDPGRRTF